MPPKKGSLNSSICKSRNSKNIVVSMSEKNALSNMFSKIKEKDQNLRECLACHEKIKSCLFKDHIETKCVFRMGVTIKNEIIAGVEEVIFISESNASLNLAPKKLTNLKISPNSKNVSKKIEINASSSIEEITNEKNLVCKSESVEVISENKEKVFSNSDENLNQSNNTINTSIQKEEITVNKEQKTAYSNGLYIAQTKLVEINETSNIIENQAKRPRSESFEVKAKIENFVGDETSNDSKYENVHEQSGSHDTSNNNFDYYLNNFTNAVQSILAEETFACLLNKFDYDIIEKFNMLSIFSKTLFVRLFQRKYKWIPADNIVYDRINKDLKPFLDELLSEGFIIDENSINTYEEIIYLFKLPQLKELAKLCHVVNISQNVKLRSDFIKLILQHFKTQKCLKFHLKSKELDKISKNNSLIELTELENLPKDNDSKTKPQFMNQCKKILGKCFKINKNVRNVFVRILMLYSLSSTHHLDPSKQDSGQQQLLQLLMVNLGKVKFMNYEIKLNIKIFQDRDSLLRYQDSLEYEYELLNFLEAKEYEEAYDLFKNKIFEFKKFILDPDLTEYDAKLPIYLRVFTSGSTYCKFLSIFAFEVLQRIRKYDEANSLFEFLIYKQNLYLLTQRAKWYERMALNYEVHLKNPLKSLVCLQDGLKDNQYVRRAGRLALYQRLTKMSETKRYSKINELKEALKNTYLVEKFEFQEAPTVEIEGTILHSEYIPGRKNIFIQNFETNDEDLNSECDSNSNSESLFKRLEKVDSFDSSENSNDQIKADDVSSNQTQVFSQSLKRTNSDVLIKNRYSISVEQVAMTHYIKNLGYTHGKHAETRVLTTMFGIVFWDIVFDKNVYNVFVDRFQGCPLDLQTDYFYLNRKNEIDSKIDLLQNSPIEFICELIRKCWDEYKDTECSLVSWSLFDDLDEFLSLVRCFTSNQVTNLCKFMAQNYRYCRSGGPDLIMWSVDSKKCKFVEVKGPGDRLSYKQMMWLDFFIKNNIECEVCYVKGQNSKRLR